MRARKFNNTISNDAKREALIEPMVQALSIMPKVVVLEVGHVTKLVVI